MQKLGWRVATIWECALREKPDAALEELSRWIRDGSEKLEIFSEAAQVDAKAE